MKTIFPLYNHFYESCFRSADLRLARRLGWRYVQVRTPRTKESPKIIFKKGRHTRSNCTAYTTNRDEPDSGGRQARHLLLQVHHHQCYFHHPVISAKTVKHLSFVLSSWAFYRTGYGNRCHHYFVNQVPQESLTLMILTLTSAPTSTMVSPTWTTRHGSWSPTIHGQ